MPNKVVLLELTQEVLEERLSAKSWDKIEKRGISYLLELQEALKEVILKLEIESLLLQADLSRAEITAKLWIL